MRLYFSIPVSLNWGKQVQPFIDKYSRDFVVDYWRRSSPYYENDILKADVVVFLLPLLAFRCNLQDLPNGVKKELDIARSVRKKIAVAYKTMEEKFNIYEAEVKGTELSAIGGTVKYIYSLENRSIIGDPIIKDPFKMASDSSKESCIQWDSRILLLTQK